MAKLRLDRDFRPLIGTSMDPEVRQLVISQMLVIALPVGTLFGLWLWMLNWGSRSRKGL